MDTEQGWTWVNQDPGSKAEQMKAEHQLSATEKHKF